MAGIHKEIQIFKMSQQHNGKLNNHGSTLPTTVSFTHKGHIVMVNRGLCFL